jgi:hypothetical protein
MSFFIIVQRLEYLSSTDFQRDSIARVQVLLANPCLVLQ